MKGKLAEKSPQEEHTPSLPIANNETATLNTKITAQGEKVREMKAAKAPKVRGIRYSVTQAL